MSFQEATRMANKKQIVYWSRDESQILHYVDANYCN